MGGIACAIKQTHPKVRVIAVELEAGPGLRPALEAGYPVPVARPAGTLADGLIPPFVGQLPLEIARRYVDEVVEVSESEIEEAMRLILSRVKLCAEGGGAAATAAILSGRVKFPPGARVVALLSGGNVDPQRLGAVLTSS